MAKKQQKPNFAKAPWQGQLFTFLQGPIWKSFVESDPFLKSQINKTLWYGKETQTYQGSNHPIATRVDTRVRELSDNALRVITLQDTEHQTFKDMVHKKFYADAPEAFIYTLEGDFREQIAEIAREREIPFNLPARVTGLNPTFQEGKIIYLPRDDFTLTKSPTLNPENNGKRFNKLENGFPIFDERGQHTWYLANSSSARVYRDGDLNAVGSNAGFGYSDADDRVVVTADVVGAPEILEGFVHRLLQDQKQIVRSVRKRYETAKSLLKGETEGL